PRTRSALAEPANRWASNAFEEGAMLILSRRCGEKLVIGGDIVLTVSEISGQRVRLALVPRGLRPIDLREDDVTAEEFLPEVQCTERGHRVLVWAHFNSGFCINDPTEVRILEVGPDRVSLGIAAPREVTIHRDETTVPEEARGFPPRPGDQAVTPV